MLLDFHPIFKYLTIHRLPLSSHPHIGAQSLPEPPLHILLLDRVCRGSSLDQRFLYVGGERSVPVNLSLAKRPSHYPASLANVRATTPLLGMFIARCHPSASHVFQYAAAASKSLLLEDATDGITVIQHMFLHKGRSTSLIRHTWLIPRVG